MLKFVKLWLPLIITASAIGTAVFIQNTPKEQQPLMLRFIEDKLKSIITPNAPIGNLTPVRDLRGTWKSSLPRKGMQIFGKLTTGPGTTTIYEDGDIELIIDSVKDNIAYGKIRFTNLCATATTTAPKIKPITVKQCTEDSGYLPAGIHVSGSALDFGTVAASGVTITMRGTYLTDIITGSMTTTLPSYGVMKGVFNLNRKQ